MNPTLGFFLWILIGGLAGWVASIIMGANARQGLANILIGVVGAVVGGALARVLLTDHHGDNGLLASLGIALFGAAAIIGLWKAVSRRGASGV